MESGAPNRGLPTWLVTLLMILATVVFWAIGPDKRPVAPDTRPSDSSDSTTYDNERPRPTIESPTR